jgi:hypothetical protein
VKAEKQHSVSEAAEHKEHLIMFAPTAKQTWSALYVACIFFMLISLCISVLCYSTSSPSRMVTSIV